MIWPAERSVASAPDRAVLHDQLKILAGEQKNRGQTARSLATAAALVGRFPFSGAGYWAMARALTPQPALRGWRRLRSGIARGGALKGLKRLLQFGLGSVGRALSLFSRQRNPGGVFFFFRTADFGGAERVHAQIVQGAQDLQPWVYFTERGNENGFLGEYRGAGRVIRPWRLAGGRILSRLYAGYLAGLISRHRHAVVFGSHCSLAYALVPLLSPHVRCVDLRHAFDAAHEEWALQFVPRLNARVVISLEHNRLRKELYRAQGLSGELAARSVVIENGISMGRRDTHDFHAPTLEVVFVGRAAPEKRVYLVGRIATECRKRALNLRFTLVGPIPEWVEPEDRAHCEFRGVVLDPTVMRRIYEQSHLLLLTSSSEGMPLVVQEAMAHAVVPISTRCGALHEHLDGTNGCIVENGDEARIVREVVGILERLLAQREELAAMSLRAWEYAQARFTAPGFAAAYRQVLLADSARGAVSPGGRD